MSLTENGANTHGSTLDACLDLFFKIGASRGKNISHNVMKAYGENPKLTSQILFHARDIRGGSGERKLFRDNVMTIINKENAFRVMAKTVEVGRWDDLHVFINTPYQDLAVSITADALMEGNSLAAKWVPRKGPMFNLLRKKMGLDPKSLRKMLVNLSNTVEQKMSAGNWSEIDYAKLPSVASARYMTAFHRNDAVRYEAYKQALSKGETKINAGAVYPYDIVKSLKYGMVVNEAVAEAQWKALPNYMEGKQTRILPVIDVSSSMNCSAGGSSVSCMDVAVSLGLYVAERNEGVFKDQFITFHESPRMMQIKGTFANRIGGIYAAPWGGSTNLQATFQLILNAAVKHKLSQEDLPEQLLIFSDMEFNQIGGYNVNRTLTNFEWAKEEFAKKGYTLPQVVFWNLNARNDNFPVQKDETGAILVSGFSPSLLKSVVGGTEYNPYQMMLKVVDVDRYTI